MSIVERPEQKRETAASLIVIGWICWFFALLVLFFHPAAARLGRMEATYIATVLAAVGLVLNTIGRRMRARAR